jgi:homoserine kinase type II
MPRWGAEPEVLRATETLVLGMGLGEADSITEVDEGWNNTNLLVDTRVGRYVIKRYLTRLADDVAWDAALLTHLAGVGFPVPRILPVGDGLVAELCGRPAVVLTHVAGDHPPLEWRSDATRWVARLHRAADGYRPAQTKSWHDLAEIDRVDHFASDLERCGLVDLVRVVADFRDAWTEATRRDLPIGIVHGDTYPGNVLTRDNDLVALLDWDTSHRGALITDVGETAIRWCPPSTTADEAAIRHAVAGYADVRALTDDEVEVLPLALQRSALGSAVQWTTGQVRAGRPPASLAHCGSFALFRDLQSRSPRWR